MYDPPSYLWAITIAGIIAIPAATCVVLYGGAVRAGLGRTRAALLAGGAAVVLGGWFTASAVIAGHGWYHARLGHGVPWMPVAVAGFFGTLLALRRIPVVARALAAPGMVNRLEIPHSFRAAGGTAFVVTMALGHLPALFALPAGLGDIAAGIAAPLVARRLAQGGGRRAALWLNAFGMTDLVVALTLGALTGFQLINVTPSGAPISELPLALIPTAAVPLLFALHITSVSALLRAPRPALSATAALATVAKLQEKTMQLKIDALKEAAAWPGADRRTLVVLASQLMTAELYQEGFEYFAARSGAAPADALSMALAGAFESRLDGRTEEAIAKLDAAAGLDLGLPHYFRGTSLARLPGCAGRAETVAADLEFVLAVKDQFPPGLLRAAYEGLSHAYETLGRTQEAEAARSRSGRLITDYLVTAGDGFRFVPPRLAELAPGVHVAQGYDFSDLAFVLTAEGIVAIDAASSPEHAAAALRDLREITELPITHVILTHAHFDHIGGLGALAADGATVIAQANFPGELRNQNSGPAPFRYLLPGGRSHRIQVAVDHLVSEPETLTIGGAEFVLIPIAGGETDDGLIIHLPDRQVVFTGDMSMPYLGAPFFAEGSAEGLFEAMGTVMALHPRLLIHGHAGLTETYTIEVFPGLLAALRDLDNAVRTGIADGLTLVEILQLNHLPQVLKEHPSAVIPYLVTRDHFIQRVHRQRTGYWHPGGEGVEHFTPAELAAAADLLGGGTAAAFRTAGAELTRRGEHALALRILDLGLLSHPGLPELLDLRRSVLQRLIERHQLLNPFKFAYYAGLADLELASAG